MLPSGMASVSWSSATLLLGGHHGAHKDEQDSAVHRDRRRYAAQRDAGEQDVRIGDKAARHARLPMAPNLSSDS